MVTSGSSRRRAVPGVLALDGVAHLVDGGEAEPHDVEDVRTRTACGRAVSSCVGWTRKVHLPAEKWAAWGSNPEPKD